jgi:plasmid stability protein
MTMPTAAPPLPIPKRSNRRWYLVGGFVLFLLATPFVYLLVASVLRDRELEQLYREMDADDPNWRWPDLLAETPELPDDQNAIVQIRNVDDLLKKSASVIAPAWHTAANEKTREVRNARLSAENVDLLRAAFKALDPKTLSEVRNLKNFPKGHIKIDPALNPYFEVFTGDEIQRARKSMALLDGEIMLRTHDNDMEGTAPSWHALLHASRAMNVNPMLICQLQRMEAQMFAVAALERLIGQGELSEADLANIQALLKRESKDNLLHLGLRGERAASHQFYLELSEGKSSIAVKKILSDWPKDFWERPGDRMPGALNKGYPEHLRILNEYVKASTFKEEDRLETMRKIDQKAFANRSSFMTYFSMPATKKSAETFHRSQTQLRCAMIAVAAERYRLKQDVWPQGLDDLLKDRLLDEIAADLFDGKLLRFKRTATGVIIYSVGLDKIDNQGQLNRNTPLAPGSDIGFELWDRHLRAAPPPVEVEK